MDIDQIIINDIGDIKKVISELSRGDEIVDISTEFRTVDGKTINLKAPSSCGYRNLLHEGFTMLRNRSEISNSGMINDGLQFVNIDGRTWVDDLVERRMGGRRDGLRVRWDLSDGVYFYDPLDSKLTKANNE